MNLQSIIENLGDFDREETIYAIPPWSSASTACVATESDQSVRPAGTPEDLFTAGYRYFLEVSIALDAYQTFATRFADDRSLVVRAMIYYATFDASPDRSMLLADLPEGAEVFFDD